MNAVNRQRYHQKHFRYVRFVVETPAGWFTKWLEGFVRWHRFSCEVERPQSNRIEYEPSQWVAKVEQDRDGFASVSLCSWPLAFWYEDDVEDTLYGSPWPQRLPMATFSVVPLTPTKTEVAIEAMMPGWPNTPPGPCWAMRDETRFLHLLLSGIIDRWPEAAVAILEQLHDHGLSLVDTEMAEVVEDRRRAEPAHDDSDDTATSLGEGVCPTG